MWSLGKVVGSPEVLRVYIGSFWDQPYASDDNAELFRSEQADLLYDLQNLPRNSAVRKVNELVKRTRLAKAHAYIIGHLREQMPMLIGSDIDLCCVCFFKDILGVDSKKAELIRDLGEEFKKIMRLYRVPPGDFPEIERFRVHLNDYNFKDFAKLDLKMFERLEIALTKDLPKLMHTINPPKEQETKNPFDDGSDAENVR